MIVSRPGHLPLRSPRRGIRVRRLRLGLGLGLGGGVHGESSYIVPSSDPISSSERSGAVIPEWPGPNSNSGSPAQHGAGAKNDEVSATGAAPEDPCRLVTRGEAAAILGEPVQTEVGMQGPTCIYQPSGSQPQMTVVVERTDLAGLRRRASQATPIGVGGESGWCLRYGSPSVAVPLADGALLHVTGPCGLAGRFAASALARVSPA